MKCEGLQTERLCVYVCVCAVFKLQGFVSDRVTLDLRGSGVDQNLDQNQVSNKVLSLAEGHG